MAAQTSDEQHFPFFKLPRELRDNVYSELLDGEVELAVTQSDGRGPYHDRALVTAFNVPEPQLHRVCRQFHEELQDAEKRHMGVRVEDNDGDLAGEYGNFGREFGLPQHIRSVRTLEAYIQVDCVTHGDLDGWDCAVAFDMITHKEWLDAVVKDMPDLRFLEIVAFAPMYRPIAYERVFMEEGNKFTDLPHLQRLTLVEMEDREAGAQKGYEGELLLEWTKESDEYTPFGDVDLDAEVVRTPKSSP